MMFWDVMLPLCRKKLLPFEGEHLPEIPLLLGYYEAAKWLLLVAVIPDAGLVPLATNKLAEPVCLSF